MNAQSAESLGDFRYGRYEFICRSPYVELRGAPLRSLPPRHHALASPTGSSSDIDAVVGGVWG